MRELVVGPLTWTYIKLFGQQLCANVRDWDGLPNSHAWAPVQSACAARLLTKAQCVGMLVAIHQRAERVELLIDDGTALVRAVQWTPTWSGEIVLGDLVRVEGKLNMDSSWASENRSGSSSSARELRVVRIHKIMQSNEELLHWLDTVDLTSTVYSSRATRTSPIEPSAREDSVRHQMQTPWDRIVTRIFLDMEWSEEDVTMFMDRTDPSPHDQVLVDTLRALVEMQRKLGTVDWTTRDTRTRDAALRVSFPDLLRDALYKNNVATAEALHHNTTRSLRHAFTTLRSSGLIYLEDPEADNYILLSAPFVLAPSVISLLRSKPNGASIAQIAEWVLTQERFKRVSIDSLEITLSRLRQAGLLDLKQDSQQYVAVDAAACTNNIN